MRKTFADTFATQVELPVQYELRLPKSGAPTRLALCIHGFAESGKVSYAKLAGVFPDSCAVLAPTAPFPVPRWRGEKQYVPAYSWYFYDPTISTYMIGKGPSTALIHHLLARLKLAELPKTLVGFSQGGYFASHLAQNLSRVERLIGIGCRFLEEELPAKIPYRMDQIFGDQDETVSPETARRSFEALLARVAVRGEFRSVPGVGHEINEAVLDHLRALLS